MTGFWIFMFIMDLLVPLSMLVIGCIFRRHPPRDISGFFGYRTKMSMKNEDTWEFAHRCCGRIWSIAGCVMLIVSATLMISVYGNEIDEVGWYGGALCLLQLIPLVGSIIPVEAALKRHFDENGLRRDL